MSSETWFGNERIVVRRLELEDIGSEYVSWFSDPDVRQFIKYSEKAPTIEALLAYWREKNEDQNVDFLGIFDARSGHHLGNMKFELNPEAQEAHVGFLIGDSKSRRQGLLRLSFPECVRQLRARRGMVGVFLTADPNNFKALVAFERLGFRSAGTVPGGDLRMDYDES